MPLTFMGLPVHALILHATVVLLPLTAGLLVLSAFSANVAARAGLLLPAAGVVSLVLVPLTTSSGNRLRARLPVNPEIDAHAAAGRALLPWAVALTVMSVAVWWVRRERGSDVGHRTLAARSTTSVAIAVLATVGAVGAVAEVAWIGHLGATATWSYVKDLPPR